MMGREVQARSYLILLGALISSVAWSPTPALAPDLGDPPDAATTSLPLVCSFVSVSDSYVMNEPVVIKFQVSNVGSAPVTLYLGYSRESPFAFGLSEQELQQRRRPPDRHQRRPWVTLKPGETHSEAVILNKWLVFDRAGRYKVSCRATVIGESGERDVAHFPVFPPPEWPRVEYKQHIEFEMSAEDGQRVEALCKNLLEVALKDTSETLSQSYEAAEVLSCVQGDVAVPFLERLAEDGRHQEDAVKGLGRLGTIRAAKALGRLSRSRRDLLATRSKQELWLLARRKDDPEITLLLQELGVEEFPSYKFPETLRSGNRNP